MFWRNELIPVSFQQTATKPDLIQTSLIGLACWFPNFQKFEIREIKQQQAKFGTEWNSIRAQFI